MEILLTRTGDPWMDWGVVAFYHFIRNNRKRFKSVDFSPGQLVVKTKEDMSDEYYITLISNHLQMRLNELILPAPEMKVLGIEYRTGENNGYYDPGYTITLSAQQKAELKDKLNNISSRPGVTLRRNYVGLKKDWSKITEELQNSVVSFFTQFSEKEKKATYCQLCGRPVPNTIFYAMRQNKNPFYNQHHNNRVRGHANTVTTGDMCPTCNLLNLFAATQYNIPYFIDSGRTHLILPRIDDLEVLYKVFSNIKSRLIDLLSPGIISYGTNIQGLRRHNLYYAVTGVYFNIVHRYIPEEDIYKEDPLVYYSEQQMVRRWVILRYSKGQNVSFSYFNYLDINPRLFEIVRGLEYGSNDDKWGNIYTTFLNEISCREPRVLGELARGIVQGNWSIIAQSLLVIKKESRRPGNKVWVSQNALSFFERFVEYTLTEVDKVLEKQLAEDIKVLGRTLGANFSADIALFTSFNNAPDTASFRHVLREAFFKMYKIGIAAKKKSEKQKELLVPGESRVENILNSITEDNIEAVKDTLLIYATLSALRPAKRAEDQDTNAEVQ